MAVSEQHLNRQVIDSLINLDLRLEHSQMHLLDLS